MVYMPNEKDLKEYVLNETGKIYSGTSRKISPKPWNFGQVSYLPWNCHQLSYRWKMQFMMITELWNFTVLIITWQIIYKFWNKQNLTITYVILIIFIWFSVNEFVFFKYWVIIVTSLLMVQWVIRSIHHGGPIKLFLVPAGAPWLV